VSIPGAEVLSKDLLGGLRWQLRQPLPAGQRVGAGVAELPIHLSGRRAPGDTAASPTPTMPLVEEVPESTRRVPLPIQLLQLGRRGIEPSRVGPVLSLRAVCLYQGSVSQSMPLLEV